MTAKGSKGGATGSSKRQRGKEAKRQRGWLKQVLGRTVQGRTRREVVEGGNCNPKMDDKKYQLM